MIKAIITTDNVVYISKHDPAIDVAGSDLDKYYEHFDERHLAFKAGEVPTRYMIRPCNQSEVRRAIGVATVDGGGLALMPEVGAQLLQVGCIGAANLDKEGDKHDWPRGMPPAVLNKTPAHVQMDLANTIYVVSNGHGLQEGLKDEGKSHSPSSSKDQEGSTKSASSASTAKKTKASGGGGGARSLRKSRS